MNNTRVLTQYQKIILAATVAFTFFIYFSSTVGVMNSGDAPQYGLTRALVEEGRTNIDDFFEYVSPDFAEHGGKHYTDREPGASFIATPFYIVAKMFLPLARLPYNGDNPALTEASKLEALTFGLASFPIAFIPVLLCLIAMRMGYSFRASWASGLLLGLGTLTWKYSAHLNRNVLTLLFYEMLFLMLLLSLKKPHRLYIFLFGFIASYTVITDHLSIITIALFFLIYFVTLVMHKKKRIQNTVVLFAAALIPLLMFSFYNYVSFGAVFTSSRLHFVKNIATVRLTFIADLSKTIPVNLFSYKSIPADVFNYVYRYPELQQTYDAYKWPSVYPYKGIFMQSPILFAGALGLLLIKKRKLAAVVLLLFLSHIAFASKVAFFFSPNSYDTRFMLPAVFFMCIGLPALIDRLLSQQRVLKWGGVAAVGVLGFLSIFNGLQSTALHYAPHVTGEHRFYFIGSPLEPQNLAQFFLHAFPNIYNLHIAGIFVIGVLSLAYFLFFKQKIAGPHSGKQ